MVCFNLGRPQHVPQAFSPLHLVKPHRFQCGNEDQGNRVHQENDDAISLGLCGLADDLNDEKRRYASTNGTLTISNPTYAHKR